MICYGIILGLVNEVFIVGVFYRLCFGVINGNRFGLVFRVIVEKIGLNFSYDVFELLWIYLFFDDVIWFM